MEIPDNLLFEMIGRREVALTVAQRQVEELARRLRRAEEALAEAREESEAAKNG